MRSIIPKDKNLLRIHGIRRSHINQLSRSGRYSFNLVERCLRDEWLILCREINPLRRMKDSIIVLQKIFPFFCLIFDGKIDTFV